MKRAAINVDASAGTERDAPMPQKARVRKVPQLSKEQIDLHKGTGKGAFGLEKALDLYKPKVAK